MEMISILIPVYKESELVETLLNQLIKDQYKEKEIITVIDEPTQNSLELVKKFKNKVKFILNKQRKGKSTALNEAAKIAKGNIFLFIDGDTIISKRSRNFLKKVLNEMKNTDLLDIQKNTFNDPLLSRISRYESLSYNFLSFLSSKLIKKTIGICGQAFAIKRGFFEEVGGFQHVIVEDAEIGMQTFVKDKTFKFTHDIEVFSKSAPSFRKWLVQRERWAVGTAQHYKKYWKVIMKNMIKYPHVTLLSLFSFWPLVISFLSLFFVNSFLEKIFMLSLISLSLKFAILTPFIFVLSMYVMLIRNILSFIVTYVASSIVFYFVSRKFKYRFSNLEFAIYYFIFSPISTFIYLFHFLRGLFLSEEVALKDWKV
jgi:cellulose synthase/poly-beta-1,6-N-acetylglucosamine synthase-like glycosyltransferase